MQVTDGADSVASTAKASTTYPRIFIQAIQNIKFMLLLLQLWTKTIHKKTCNEVANELEQKVMAGWISA